MTDHFPQNIEIEVDRGALRRYLRTKWLGSWILGLGVLGCFFGFATITGRLDDHDWNSLRELILLLVRGMGPGILIGIVAAVVLYCLRSHRLAARMAASLKVTVEGAFLHVIQEGHTRTDRKLHFRSIVDYSTVEDNMMRRFGLKALQMTTTGGGPQSTFRIIGLKDCLEARDMLAEVDSIREKE